ncbi:unnamed protein product [Gordionus sp. m RMFG-2023]
MSKITSKPKSSEVMESKNFLTPNEPKLYRTKPRSGSRQVSITPQKIPLFTAANAIKDLGKEQQISGNLGDNKGKPPVTASGLNKAQKQVDEVVDIMKENIEKILERDTKLQDLDSRCDTLKDTSSAFKSTTKKIEKKFWWKDKIYLIIIFGVLTFIIVSVMIGIIIHFA